MSDSLDISTLSGMMAKVLLVFLTDARDLNIETISQRSGVADLKRLRLACDELARVKGYLAVRSGARGRKTWVRTGLLLTWGGLPLVQDGPNARTEVAQDRQNARAEVEQNGPNARTGQAQNGQNALTEKPQNPQNGQNARQSPNKAVQNGQNARTEETLEKLEVINQTQSEDNLTDSVLAKKQILLENAYLLFGKSVAWHAAFAGKDRQVLLAWLAQAWEASRDGNKLRSPWGLVYRGLQGKLPQKRPYQRYLADPLAHLPADYLRACGLLPGVERIDPEETEPADDDDAGELPAEDELLPDELLADELMRDDPALLSPEQARLIGTWELLLAQLERQIPRGSFNAWLQDTRALDWEPAAGQVRVLARDPDAVEWLENRMCSTVSRMLSGMLDCPVQVQFVCPPPGTEQAAQVEIGLDVRRDEYGLPLSPAMQRALRGLVLGKTRALVAWEMGISPNTLKVYLWKAFRRLGANNAADAAVRALELGLDLR